MQTILDHSEQDNRYLFEYFEDARESREILVPEGMILHYLALVSGQSEIKITLMSGGEHACVYSNCLIIGQSNIQTSVDLQASLRHSHSAAHVHMVTMLLEGSDCQVSGDIQIFPGIVKAEGRLLEENIILGNKIKIHTLPKLDVRSNDVVASHGARIETLDSKKLFYLESKGISKQESKRLMLEGYVEGMFSVVESIKYKVESIPLIEEIKRGVMRMILEG